MREYRYIRGISGKLREIEKSGNANSVNIELGQYSQFCAVDEDCKKWRIMDYPLDKLRRYHFEGHHSYNIDKTYIDCDYIISIPKLKTHMKAGMTGAMKNFVGAVSDKTCIPHHTKGSASSGKGDCYDKTAFDKWIGENLYDYAYGFIESSPSVYEFLRGITNRGIIRIRRKLNLNDNMSGSWHGNMTLPRAIIDINRAITYGGKDGQLYETPQRRIFTLMDCIVIGDGNGPLSPRPNPMGTIIFSDSCPCADMAAATLIGFDYKQIHYLSRQGLESDYAPLLGQTKPILLFNGKRIESMDELKKYQIIDATPAKYWMGYIERRK